MINLRNARQNDDLDCGVTALQVVMEYYGVEIRGDRLRRALKMDQDGISHFNMIELARKRGFEVFAAEGVTVEQVKDFIDKGYPVIVLLQAWAERYMTLKDWESDYDDGHYVVIIGYQDSVVIFEDPSSLHRTWLTENELNARWHDLDPKTNRKLEHFALVLMGKEPVAKGLEHMG